MLQKLNFFLVSIFFTASCAFSQTGLGTVKGTVKDGDTKQPIPFCKVVLLQSGSVKGGANTDFDGKFIIMNTGINYLGIFKITKNTFHDLTILLCFN